MSAFSLQVVPWSSLSGTHVPLVSIVSQLRMLLFPPLDGWNRLHTSAAVVRGTHLVAEHNEGHSGNFSPTYCSATAFIHLFPKCLILSVPKLFADSAL